MTAKKAKIILGVGGGIAAYKACDLVRRLQDQNMDLHVVLTEGAQKFVTALTFQALSQNPVHTDLFSLTEESEMGHIQLADSADAVIIAPATADLLAKIAHGFAGDLLTTLLLVTRAPVFLAPSMNVNMWNQAVVQTNLKLLKDRGYHIIEPESGSLACGWEGQGRLAEVDSIVKNFLDHFSSQKKNSLAGKKVLITAGPTREYLDPVRFISNPSSGKMGFALAAAARQRGAEVTLVTGPVGLATPPGVTRLDVQSAEQMFTACEGNFSESDILIASAAVGDYRPSQTFPHKIKKDSPEMNFHLVQNRDVLLSLSEKKRPGQIFVGFAAETQELEKNAQAKLKRKNLDLIVANDISLPGLGFDSDRNHAVLIDRKNAIQRIEPTTKSAIAERILDAIEGL